MCKLVIVGHGNFPSGVLSAVSLLVGNNENICAFDLDKNETHEGFEQKIKELLDNNDKVIVVADLTGGAPHQIAARLILESGKMNQYIISGINLALVVDLAMKCCFSEVEEEELETMLLDSVNDSKETMTLLSNRM
ncbi:MULTISPECIES: PTS sugar transporter subunit IIA [Clostridium]|jgi:PTS system N-acetylgalactosamine-specific IIA component|uniref:Phosphotransferase system, mannose/fructose-specific component IIA n=2 Tax=Clostridium butyricum TaxID=1492 RepID=C4IN36_CLOBU|nr:MULTISPECIES: PTS sugar transporter [Clostridium]ETI91904.1 MAG: Phosphotransferase system, mannose/fructose-specific component IIA [Clostridium butyricum DORA_1]ALP88803.1 PTS sugar transporter [Clostridium butyricum]ALS18407.1 PTS sugar transporter [Clostridium butyricum]ANF15533.1 PTS sugar transporter [Clostridium butyricum]AOR95481.1 PTS sugar transporter [Clostridium butyricum]